MQLPIDVKALLDEATNTEEARQTAISVGVCIDDSASEVLVAHVRNAFASSLPSVRMTVSYIDDSFAPHPTDDIAVLVAGPMSSAGMVAESIRAVGVPVMVVTDDPVRVNELALSDGHAIPDGDIVSPWSDSEAYGPLDEAAFDALDERMGRWIVSVCHDKRLTLAMAFPFMRRAIAKDSVQTTALQNAGIGLVPFIPGADLPIMTLNQAKMVLQIAAAYGQDMSKGRIKEIATVVGGAYLCRTAARQLVEFVPFLGFLFKTAIAYGGTAAIGYAIIDYFEGGGNVTGVANVVEQAASKGSTLATTVQGKVEHLAPTLADALSRAQDKAATTVPQLVESLTSQVTR